MYQCVEGVPDEEEAGLRCRVWGGEEAEGESVGCAEDEDGGEEGEEGCLVDLVCEGLRGGMGGACHDMWFWSCSWAGEGGGGLSYSFIVDGYSIRGATAIWNRGISRRWRA